jgi:23S rRNA (uracil1939-C5)-methyltransferase
LVLADPPRAGLRKTVTAQLRRLAPQRIVDRVVRSATLARDLAALSNYRIEEMTLVDLFPQTYHLETVVSLRLIE